MAKLREIIKKEINKIIPDYYLILKKDLVDCRTILDLGCGKSSPISECINNNAYCYGVDIFEPYLKEAKKIGFHNDYVLADVTNLPFINKKSFDGVLALDLVEHLDEEEAKKLIKTMEEIAVKKTIVVTPNGFLPQEPYNGNKYQRHKSGWAKDFFLKQGFKVKGIRGLRYLRGERAKIKFKPEGVWTALSYLTQPLTLRNPDLAFQLYCVKEL